MPLDADDPARAVPFARAVVDAKVRKQMVLLQRLIISRSRRWLASGADRLDTYRRRALHRLNVI